MGRSKERFIEETGGFLFGHPLPDEVRFKKIKAIRDKISRGLATEEDVDQLSWLMGVEQDEY